MSEIERAAIEKAIKGFEHEMRSIKNSAAREYNREKQERKIERETLAVLLLRAELSRQKNEPLTHNEMIEISDDPRQLGTHVWVKRIKDGDVIAAITDITKDGFVAVWSPNQKSDRETGLMGYFTESNYGKTWLAYRYEPKGEKA